MSAVVIILQNTVPDPLVDDDWHEQLMREEAVQFANRINRPPRTWPILILDNERKESR